MRRHALGSLLGLALLLARSAPAAEAEPRRAPVDPRATLGFSLQGLRVRRDLVRAGAPAPDLIRAVDEPRFAPPDGARWVDGSTPVLGLELDGEAHAYPVHVIERHWAVNDVLGGVPVLAVFDPMSGAALAFERRVDGKTLRFGVSGLVYDAASLLYDHETRSLWSPLLGRAIAGPLAGKALPRLRLRREVLDVWLGRAPGSLVLVPPSRHIDYRYSLYKAYWIEDRIPFPVAASDERFHAKELVLGVVAHGKARAYLGSLLTRAGGKIRDEFQGRELRILYNTDEATFTWEIPDDVAVTECYWFAWKAFHPDTEVWKDPGPGRWKP